MFYIFLSWSNIDISGCGLRATRGDGTISKAQGGPGLRRVQINKVRKPHLKIKVLAPHSDILRGLIAVLSTWVLPLLQALRLPIPAPGKSIRGLNRRQSGDLLHNGNHVIFAEQEGRAILSLCPSNCP
jgi:hypothetical protein